MFYTKQLVDLHSIRHLKDEKKRNMYYNDALQHIFEDNLVGKFRCDKNYDKNLKKQSLVDRKSGSKDQRYKPYSHNRNR